MSSNTANTTTTPSSGDVLKYVSVGDAGVWAIDMNDKILVRMSERTGKKVIPGTRDFGSSWASVNVNVNKAFVINDPLGQPTVPVSVDICFILKN